MNDQLRLGETPVTLDDMDETGSYVGTPRATFLTGLFATWLAGEGRATASQRQTAERAARAALAELSR